MSTSGLHVAAGILPASEPGILPASEPGILPCGIRVILERRAMPADCFSSPYALRRVRSHLLTGRQDAALTGRQDARRYRVLA